MEIKEKYIHSFRLPFDELINTKENNINKVTKNGGYNHNMEKWTGKNCNCKEKTIRLKTNPQ